MKKMKWNLLLVLSLVFLLTLHSVPPKVTAQENNKLLGNTQNAATSETISKERITKTVKTQKQLTQALQSTNIDTIIIKPTKATTFTIPKSTYNKELLVYQAYTTLSNEGVFDYSNIIVTSQYQINKAVKTKNINSIQISTTTKNNFILNAGYYKTELIINAPNSNITNSVKWKNITIENMEHSTWTEKGLYNNFLVSGNMKVITIDKKSTIKSININQQRARNITIKLDGKVKKAIIETGTEIILSGRNMNDFVQSLINKTSEYISIIAGDKVIWVKPEVKVTPTPIQMPEDKVTPTATPTPIEIIVVPNVPVLPTEPIVPVIPSIPVVPVTPEAPVTPIPTTVPEAPVTPIPTTVPEAPVIPTPTTVPEAPVTPTPPLVPVHTHTYESAITLEATCNKPGVKTYICISKDSTYTVVIPPIDHIPGEWITTKEASTTSTGTQEQRCIPCNKLLSERVIEMLPIIDDTPPTDPIGEGVYTLIIESTDGYTPSNVVGKDNLTEARKVFDQVNELRRSLGLNSLEWNTILDDYTQLRAAEVTQKFNHERPNLQRGYQMNEAIHSENIAVGYETASEVMDGWSNSTAHYNAMIRSDYTGIAVGCFEELILDSNGNSTGQYYTGWVQFFSK